jgi:hypothetical protein
VQVHSNLLTEPIWHSTNSNIWSADLSELSAIEDVGEVTLRWTTSGVTVEGDLGASGNATEHSGSVAGGQDKAFLRLEALTL